MPKNPPSMAPVDPAVIQRMFDGLAGRYDRFNRLSSLGLDALWRREVLASVRPGMRVLDLGCGTGDLAIGAAKRLGGSGEAVGLDFSAPMLRLAEEKRVRAGVCPVRWELRPAEDIPFEDRPYDAVVSGFVLRNIYANIRPILGGVFRALKPGGVISFVDLTEPANPLIRSGGSAYLATAAAFFGRICFGAAYPKTYLRESMKRFFRAREFAALLAETGFEDIRCTPRLFGMITRYEARKPA